MKNLLHKPSALWIGIAIAFCVAAIAFPLFSGSFHIRVGQQVLLFGGLAIAWSILGGFTNYWSFGHAAFVGLGAFSSGLLEQNLGGGFSPISLMLFGLAFSVIITAAVAYAIAHPILKLRGIYFAIAMLAVAEILGEASRNFDFLQGAMGFSFPQISVSGLNKIQLFYYLFLALFLVNAALFLIVRRSKLGIALICIGQDEDTAAMLGVPTEKYKRIAFVLSAVLASIAGVLYGHSLGFVTSSSVFRMDISLNMILFTMIGGIGTLSGPIIGTLVMIIATQVLLGDLIDFHMLLTGVLLITIVLLAPKGLIGAWLSLISRFQRLPQENAR